MMHVGRHRYWRSLLIDKTDKATGLHLAKQAIVDEWDVEDDSSYHTQELALSLMDYYAEHASVNAGYSAEEDWRIVALEERCEVETPVGVLSFQLDTALESNSGDRFGIVDLKTASKCSGKWLEGLETSVQLRLYKKAAGMKFERDVDFVMVEGLQKKSPFSYVPVDVSEQWSDGFVEDAFLLWVDRAGADTRFLEFCFNHALDEVGILQAAATITAYNFMDCMSYYSPCDYWDCCRMDPEGRLGWLLAETREVEPKY
jgi:hypothetical protein